MLLSWTITHTIISPCGWQKLARLSPTKRPIVFALFKIRLRNGYAACRPQFRRLNNLTVQPIKVHTVLSYCPLLILFLKCCSKMLRIRFTSHHSARSLRTDPPISIAPWNWPRCNLLLRIQVYKSSLVRVQYLDCESFYYSEAVCASSSLCSCQHSTATNRTFPLHKTKGV